MDKKCTIYDYNDTPTEITIENFENVKDIHCRIISGDEILVVKYNDGTEKHFDSYAGKRLYGYDDGTVLIPIERLDEFSKITNSYEMLRIFVGEDAVMKVGFQAFSDLCDIFKNGL